MTRYNNNYNNQNFDDENHHQQQQQQHFRPPAPLQPAALTRSDNDGMYVAVGPSAVSRNNNNNNNQQQQQFTRNTITNKQNNNNGLVHTPHENDNQRSISQQQDYYHTSGGGRPDGSSFYSQPLESENHAIPGNNLRDAREPYVKSRIDYDVSANQGKFRHHRVLMRDKDDDDDDESETARNENNKFGRRSLSAGRGRSPHKGTPPKHFPYASGHVKYGVKQHWLAGYTCWDWCSNAASCLDGCLCMWCINGMQWRRLHAKPRTEGGGRFEVFFGVAEDEGDREMNRKYRTEGGGKINNINRKNDQHDSDGGDENDDDDAENNIPDGERRFIEAHSENIFDKCARIDWGCCLISCLGDLITCPLLLTPLGSAAAQFHIRRELRARYNLVDAPGSPSAEELEKMEIQQMEKQLQRREEAAKEKERISFEQKKFNRAPPQPSPSGGARKPAPGQLQNDSYDYKFSKNETNPGTEPEENNNNNSKNAKKGNDDTKNNNNSKKDQEDAEKPSSSSSSSCISDETKEYLISWCCTPCSTAQVQREMTMRGEWPGGYWTKPMRVRADLAPGRGVRDALRAFASLSPQRQHQTIDHVQPSMSSNANTPRRMSDKNETSTTTTKVTTTTTTNTSDYHDRSNNVKKVYPTLMSQVPPSRAGPQQPPPTPNERRYQGSGAKESDVIRNDNVAVIENENLQISNNNDHYITPGNNNDDDEVGNNGNFHQHQEQHHDNNNFKISSPPVRSPEYRRNSDTNNLHQPTPPSAQAEHDHDHNEHNNNNNNNNNEIPQSRRSYSPDSPMKPTPGLGFRNRDQTDAQE